MLVNKSTSTKPEPTNFGKRYLCILATLLCIVIYPVAVKRKDEVVVGPVVQESLSVG